MVRSIRGCRRAGWAMMLALVLGGMPGMAWAQDAAAPGDDAAQPAQDEPAQNEPAQDQDDRDAPRGIDPELQEMLSGACFGT